MTQGLNSVSNYLVPATGTTNAYQVRETFTATPFVVDFNFQGLDGIPFRPYGVIIDNTQSANAVTVTINQIALQITCGAGQSLQLPYPGPVGHTASITGNGVATVIFTDYPVMPFSSATGGGGSVPNPLPVTGPLTDAELRASDVPVTGDWLTDAQLRATAVPVSLPANVTVTAASVTSTTTGTVAAGARMASFSNTGAAAATVAGGPLAAGATITFEAPSGTVLAAIAYVATGTTLVIASVA